MAATHQMGMVETASNIVLVPGDVVMARPELSTGELARFGRGPYEVVGSERPFGGTEWLFLKRLPDGPRLKESVHPSCLVLEHSHPAPGATRTSR